MAECRGCGAYTSNTARCLYCGAPPDTSAPPNEEIAPSPKRTAAGTAWGCGYSILGLVVAFLLAGWLNFDIGGSFFLILFLMVLFPVLGRILER